jgi:hypothetical protein
MSAIRDACCVRPIQSSANAFILDRFSLPVQDVQRARRGSVQFGNDLGIFRLRHARQVRLRTFPTASNASFGDVIVT